MHSDGFELLLYLHQNTVKVVAIYLVKHLHVSEPVQFKHMLFKGKLYFIKNYFILF